MADETVLYEVRDGVAVLTLNRPDKLNAWNAEMNERHVELLDRAEADPDVRVIVLTGAGRGFCPGVDVDWLAELAKAGGAWRTERPVTWVLELRKPMIAAINGACVGYGLLQAMLCDIRFLADGAKVGAVFPRRGLIAEYGITSLLTRTIGEANTLELLLSGRLLAAPEALSLGLVHRVVPGDDLLSTVLAYAGDMAANCSPQAMATTKQLVRADWLRPPGEAEEVYMAARVEAANRVDFAEGVASFIERRPPRFAPLPPP